MRRFIEGPYYRAIASVLVFSMVCLSFPLGAIQVPTRANPNPKAPATPASRALSAKEMDQLSGKNNPNPYASGTNGFSVVHAGVDVLTGNFTHSVTDWSVSGSLGIPASVTRTYSANNPDEGPLGKGWVLSTDMRTTVGGLLKGAGAPSRSIPVSFKEHPVGGENDPHYGNTAPYSSVTAVDASGYEEAVQIDADGILTTPAWDKNVIDREYEIVTTAGGVFFVTTSCVLLTPEGTTYVYEKKGWYTGDGAYALDGAGQMVAGTAAPSNVLKVVSITDRLGNETQFTYSGTGDYASFAKANGQTSEAKLLAIDTPDGRQLSFTWGSGDQANRIVSITDGTSLPGGAPRQVVYGYGGAEQGFNLTSFTSAGGKTTSYTYYTTLHLLHQITDPRGLTTTITYVDGESPITPYGFTVPSVFCYRVDHPSGVSSFFTNEEVEALVPDGPYLNFEVGDPRFMDAYQEGSTWVRLSEGEVKTTAAGGYSEPLITQSMGDPGPVGGPVPLVFWKKTIHAFSHDVLETFAYSPVKLADSASFHQERFFEPTSGLAGEIHTETAYNFMGMPLAEQTWEKTDGVLKRSSKTEHAYWGDDKYFQRKASRSAWSGPSPTVYNFAVYSYTDYIPASAPTGRGLPLEVWDSVNATFSGTSGADWRDQIAPLTGAKTASFQYDAYGRATLVQKMHRGGPAYPYVQTQTAYDGSFASPFWGAATEVVEDLGGANRITRTLAYDSMGRATRVQNPLNKIYDTTFFADGEIDEIWRASQLIAKYEYGASGPSLGQPTLVTDGLTGRWQSITYGSDHNTPWEEGVPVVTAEGKEGESALSTVAYTYYPSGDRKTATYTTPNGVTQWGYSDYIEVGSPDRGARAFQTMTQLDGSFNATPNEFQYAYDQAGRLRHAAFAQTPQPQRTSWPFYTFGDPAQTRAHTLYSYDGAGRSTVVETYFQTWVPGNPSGGDYADQSKIGQEYDYDERGLRSTQELSSGVPGSAAWSLLRTETYGYETQRGYLTGVDYGDSQSQSWAYDLAGNRGVGSWTYDNLNRLTARPGVTYQNDLLGNRTWENYGQTSGKRYVYDELSRATSICAATDGAAYEYRADGMRVEKVSGLTITWNPADEAHKSGWYDDNWSVNKATTRYFYDGQMCMEEDFVPEQGGGETTKVTRYGLGARGIDYMEQSITGGSPTKAYPLYDGHGNMLATISLSGTLSNQRHYDVWGAVRAEQDVDSMNPRGQHVANLGHQTDVESSLVYMRARYYDPGTGRFVTEDPARDGGNWFVYCNNDPVNMVDSTGLAPDYNKVLRSLTLMLLGIAMSRAGWFVASMDLAFLSIWYLGSGGTPSFKSKDDEKLFGLVFMTLLGALAVRTEITLWDAATEMSPASRAIGLWLVHIGFLELFLTLEES